MVLQFQMLPEAVYYYAARLHIWYFGLVISYLATQINCCPAMFLISVWALHVTTCILLSKTFSTIEFLSAKSDANDGVEIKSFRGPDVKEVKINITVKEVMM